VLHLSVNDLRGMVLSQAQPRRRQVPAIANSCSVLQAPERAPSPGETRSEQPEGRPSFTDQGGGLHPVNLWFGLTLLARMFQGGDVLVKDEGDRYPGTCKRSKRVVAINNLVISGRPVRPTRVIRTGIMWSIRTPLNSRSNVRPGSTEGRAR
jgi:hypothetical protein